MSDATAPLNPGRPCRKCGCPLTFSPNIETGKQVPLDTRADVYVVYTDDRGVRKAWNIADLLLMAGDICLKLSDGTRKPLKVEGVYVTHFATCTDPAAFRKSNGQQPGLFPGGPREGMR